MLDGTVSSAPSPPDFLGRAAGGWVDLVRRRAGLVVAAMGIATAGVLWYTAHHLGLNSDEDALFGEGASFLALQEELRRLFPALVDPIVVVIEGDTPERVADAEEKLALRLRADGAHFRSVFQPSGGPFFDEHGLLYLELEELEELADTLAAMQPYLAELSRDRSLRGLFGLLSRSAEAVRDGELDAFELAPVLDRVSRSIEATLEGEVFPLPWAEILMGGASLDRRRLLLVEPVIDFGRLQPAELPLLRLRALIEELGLNGTLGVRARLTGSFVLSYEEMEQLRRQAAMAGLASFLLVAFVLVAGLRSARLVLSALLTLVVGLVWTAGFAAAAIGHLNLISITFAVLFIGLSIDFAIHLCIRYQELLAAGLARAQALDGAARTIGGSLALCAATTAAGFYAFVPTDYAGVAELGLIAGTGMFIGLFANLTLLPALLALAGPRSANARAPRLTGLRDLPVRHSRPVLAATAAIALGAALLLPDLHFDANPLRLRDPSTESVQAFNDLLADGVAFPWNLNVLAADLDAADDLAERLEALEVVDATITLSDFVPDRQAEKLAILEDAAFLLLPSLEVDGALPPPSPQEKRAAIAELEASLGSLEAEALAGREGASLERLRAAVSALLVRLAGRQDGEAAIAELESSLLGGLGDRLRALRAALRGRRIGLGDLPHALVSRMIAADGRARVEVFPRDDLNDARALERYVSAVREIASNAFGEGLAIIEAERAVVGALRQALLTAAVVIAVLLVAWWRSLAGAALVGIPLLLAAMLTAAASVVLESPLNFANVIVIPLLLGMGVDTGIHLVHRYRTTALPDGNLLRTPTARAVVVSSATTVASFGTLGFATHPGLASLGLLLTLGVGLLLICNLVVLPALIGLHNRP